MPLPLVPSERSPWRRRGEHLSGREPPRQGGLDPSAGLLTETITGWTAPSMSAPLPFGTVHRTPASHAEPAA